MAEATVSGAFVAQLSDVEAEIAETQVWIEFAVRSGYVDRERAAELYSTYDRMLGTIIGMITYPESWLLPGA